MTEETEARRGAPVARLEQAARAAWLYYIAGRTQDEIAAQLQISRQAAQRLVSLAVAEKVIKFRLDHPIAACMALADALTVRHALRACEVVPSDATDPSCLSGLAVAGARFLERWFAHKVPTVFAFSTGRTLRAVAAELSPQEAPHHKVMSLCGTISADGRATAPEPVLRIAERTGAQCYPMPTPVIATTAAEVAAMQGQRPFQALRALGAQVRCAVVGISAIAWKSPLHASGYITDAELTELLEGGAVGEIAGWSFDARGRLLQGGINDRVVGLLPRVEPGRVMTGIGAGPDKVGAFVAALRGGLLNGLITDEATAAAILAAP